MTEEYDSTADTLEHIRQVGTFLAQAMGELARRGSRHDHSKLLAPEKQAFDRESQRLKQLEYGSEEYYASLERLSEGLRHHYANNSHHPEHYEEGVAGMDLFDLLEMVADWKAAAMRMSGGDSAEPGLEINIDRFGIDPQLAAILRSTLDRWPNG